ncbi:MAG TPA: hypothetical protein PLC58_07785, partial [Denitromonas sp.]|nr:hypothetical protein [Denitromonas sp.]
MNPEQDRPEPGKRVSFVLAALVHLALAAFLFFGVRWQSEPPAAVQVALVAVPSMPTRTAPMGSLNVIFATHPALIEERPEVVAAMMKVHKDASEFCMTKPEETAQAAVEIFGMKPEAVAVSLPNV